MNRVQRSAAGVIATVTAGSLILGIAPVAFADSGPTKAERAAAVVEKATGTTDIAPSTAGSAKNAAKATTAVDGGTVIVTAPADAGGEVKATAPDGSTLGLGLPETKNVTGAKAGDGTVIYPDAAKSTDIAVQPTTDGGARALVTLKDHRAATTQRFDLSLPKGAELAPDGTGGYEILKLLDGGGMASMGSIKAPWAKDANGKDVPTSYRLAGSTLIQQIDTAKDTAFPVVADPKWTWGNVTGTVYLNRKETNKLALGAGLSTVLGALSGPLAIPGIVTAASASYWYNEGACVKIKYGMGWFGPFANASPYKGGYCR